MTPEKVVIGNAELWHADCREVLPLLPKHDLLLTDPPYGIGADIGGGTRASIAAKWAAVTGANRWDEAPPPHWLFGLMREMTTWQCIWGGNYFELPPTKCWLLWDKETAGVTTFADAEMAWTNFDKALRLKRYLWNGLVMKVKEHREHPTQKPLPIITWCIHQAPKDVQTVLDPFMGSGTTGVACAQLGKAFTGIERERRYFDIACERIARAQAQGVLFQETEQPVQESFL
jgi:DNA modification methylase